MFWKIVGGYGAILNLDYPELVPSVVVLPGGKDNSQGVVACSLLLRPESLLRSISKRYQWGNSSER